MKRLRGNRFWFLFLFSVVLAALAVTVARNYSKEAWEILEEYQKDLIKRRNEFMEQCQQDGYSKTDCLVKYQDI